MITDSNRKFSINKANSTWFFTTNTVGVSFSNPTGKTTTENEIIVTDIIYDNESVVAIAVVNLLVIDERGCQTIKSVPIKDPCADFQVGNININIKGTSVTAYAPVTGGSAPANIEYYWVAQPQFQGAPVETGDSPVFLFELPDDLFNQGSYRITLNVVDKISNCSKSVTLNTFAIFKIVTPNILREMDCYLDDPNSVTSLTFTLNSEDDDTLFFLNYRTFSWSTLVVENNYAPTIDIYHNGNGQLTFTQTDELAAGQYIFPYYVVDDDLRASDTSFITIDIPDCGGLTGGGTTTNLASSGNVTKRIKNSDSATDVLIFQVEDRFLPTEDLDWSTFEITKASSSPYGTAAFNSNTRVIEYTINSINQGVIDSFEWQIANTKGVYSKRFVDIVNYNILALPVVTPLTIDTVLLEPTSEIDLTTQFDSNVISSSISVDVHPNVNVVKTTNGFIFTPQEGSSAQETLTFRGSNANNEEVTSTITVNVVYAGNVVNNNYDLTCRGKIVNVSTFFENVLGSYNITQTSINTTDLVITDPTGLATVDFTAATNETYTFTLTATNGSATDTATVNIIKQASPAINILNITDHENGTFTLTFEYESIITTSLEVLIENNPAVFLSSIVYDDINNTAVFTANYEVAPGANVILLRANSVCGNLIQESTTDTSTIV